MPRTLPGESLNPFRIFRNSKNFRIFWTGQTASLIGTWMQTMAQGWLALELTNNAFLVGLVATIGSLPILLFSFPAGVLADRRSKLRLVTIFQTLMLLEATALWWMTLTGRITIGWLLALAAINGTSSAFEIPARQALMVELVDREDLHDAIALNSSGFNLARILGPSVAAAVIARFGLSWCFGLNALSYLSVLGGLFLIRIPAWRPVVRRRLSPMQEIVQGFRYIARTREISVLMQTALVFSVFGVPYLILMPVVARDMLKLDASGYGVLLACVGIGGLGGALFLASVGRRIVRGRLLRYASFAYATMLICFALTRSIKVAMPILLLTGCMMILNNALTNGLLQSLVPDEFRGRLMATYSFVVVGLAQVLGAFVGGAVARLIGVDWAIGAGATIMLGYSLWAFQRYPELSQL
jgi:MFS family permease